MKLSKKQSEIINLMRDGWILLIGTSEITGRQYYMVTKGFDKVYFNVTVFSNLLDKKMIYQELSSPFDYLLTDVGRIAKIN